MEEQSDGLLRGSRKDRIAQMLSLREAEWNLYTLLDLHLGLLDHAEEVRLAATESLQAIAAKIPEPITLTPADFLARHMFSFTAASGAARQIFEFLVELGTPEAIQLAKEALEHVSRNEDFKAFLETLAHYGRLDLLRQLPQDKLGKVKRDLVRRSLGET
jgi:hypothetical protein